MQEWVKHGNPVEREDMERHDKWLSMMWPRLNLLRELLSDDGVIFVSIDDNEVHRLRLLLDEVLGEENFLAVVSWQGMDTIKNDARNFSTNTEYVSCYAKKIDNVVIKGIKKQEKHKLVYKNYDNDQRGPYLLTPLHAKSGSEAGVYEFAFPNGQAWSAPRGTFPRFSRETLERLVKEGRIYLDAERKKVPQKKTYLSEVSDRMRPWTFWKYEDFGSTRQANSELGELLGKGEFQNPKPSKLIRQIVDLVADKDSLVLDSFAGSGTTAHAVLDLNKEDGGDRKFILIECEEYANKITAERVRRVIKGVKNARDEDLKKGLGGSFTYCTLGQELNVETLLKGERLPDFPTLARYVFYTATGQTLEKVAAKPTRDFYIGETDMYRVHLVYKPDKEFLRSGTDLLPLRSLA
jgi:adenine-specific DNA-methyltransferase